MPKHEVICVTCFVMLYYAKIHMKKRQSPGICFPVMKSQGENLIIILYEEIEKRMLEIIHKELFLV